MSPEAFKKAQELQNKLAKYRFDQLRKGSIELQEIPGDCDPRSRQVMTPLYTIATSDEIRQTILAYLKKHHPPVITSPKQSLEGIVISAVRELFNEKKTAYCAAIRQKIILKNPELDQEISSRKVGAILRNLKLKTIKNSGGYYVSATPDNKKRLSELENRYGLNNNNKGENNDEGK